MKEEETGRKGEASERNYQGEKAKGKKLRRASKKEEGGENTKKVGTRRG